MDDNYADKQAAENLGDMENMRAAADLVQSAENTLEKAGVYLDHTEGVGLSEVLGQEVADLVRIRNDIDAAFESRADRRAGESCDVSIYEPEGHRHSLGDYVFEVTESHRGQRHTYQVIVDEPEGQEVIVDAVVVESVSMDDGSKIETDSLGSTAGLAWVKAIDAVVSTERFGIDAGSPTDILSLPEV